nr:putative reverse transcriptase domain-containing protein [Tanacetum cinerariifolium]
MADQSTMAQLLQAPTKGYENAIVVPTFTADNFELKHGLLTLVQNKQFFGLDKEDPHAHIRCFNKITSTLKFPNVLNTLRNEITNFQQWFDESFSEAWDRFKDLLRACPHHGFLELHNALNSKDQDSLNSAAGGNFLDKIPRECLAIIESKSKVRYSRDKLVVAKVSTNASTFGVSPDVAELKDLVKALLLDKKVNYNQGNTSYCPSMMSNQIRPPGFPLVPNNQNVQRNDQNRFIPNQNRGNNFNQGPVYQPQVFQPSAYQAPAYQAPAPQTQCVSKEDFSAYVIANDAVMKNMQTQGQNMQNQLTNLTNLINKFVNFNAASTSSSSTLSSNTIANPKSDLKAITTRSGVSYDGPQIPPKVVENRLEDTKDMPVTSPTSEPAIAPVSASKPNPKASIPYPSRKNDERNRKYLIPCDFPCMAECLALADLGASINLMPFSVWKRISLLDLKPTCMTLELADRSISRPVGVAEDVYVKVGSFHFLADFIVVDFDADPRVPLILRRSFLKTGRALIDVFEEGDILLLEAFLNDDPSLPPPNQRNHLPEVRKELKICEAKSDKSLVNEPSVVELKVLPPHLEYAFLEGDDKLPVIIAKDLSVEEKTALLTLLKSHKRAIAWKLSDIKGINPKFCTHKILMQEDFEATVQHQRRVNPKIHDVIKQKVIKLLDVGLIYPISDSPWVSPVHCVPKKGRFVVVENEDNELILTRLVTGWRICIDYCKLNEATRKDHFPLPFMDQMLERLAGNQYYCFLDGFLGNIQIPIDPKDQEKTTFTCAYGTFAYRRIPFGLCNAPGTFQRCMMAIFNDMIKKTMEV